MQNKNLDSTKYYSHGHVGICITITWVIFLLACIIGILIYFNPI